MRFDEFDFSQDLLDGMQSMGFTQPTEIQEQAIPAILGGKDLLACAQTGTGKTGAFILPVIDQIYHHFKAGKTRALVLAPTRELAKQIDEAISGFTYFLPLSSIAVYGGNKKNTKGEDFSQQKNALKTGVDIVIATPGRLMMHMNLGYVDFSGLKYFILDEADKMMDMGFIEDIMTIHKSLPKEKQTLLFSATMPQKIRKLSKEILHDPFTISLAVSLPAAGIDQKAYLTYNNQKVPLLRELLKTLEIKSMLIFTSRKIMVDEIASALRSLNFDARGIHSDKDQGERESILEGFKNHQFPILVATDILSRGIDVDSISHVVNFDVPRDPEDYIHRIGRTARYGTTGQAITFINKEDQRFFQKIEKLIQRELDKEKNPEFIGPGPSYNVQSRGGGGQKRNSGGGGNKNRNYRSKGSGNKQKPQNQSGGGTDRNQNRQKNQDNRNKPGNKNS